MKKSKLKTIFLCSSATQLSVYVCLYKSMTKSMVNPSNILVHVCNPNCNDRARSNIYTYSTLLGFRRLDLSNELFNKQKKNNINLIARRNPSNYELNEILSSFTINKHTVLEDGIGDYINKNIFSSNSFYYICRYLIFLAAKYLSLLLKLIRMDLVSIFYLKVKLGMIKRVELPLIGSRAYRIDSKIFTDVYKSISKPEPNNKKFKLIILGSIYSSKSDKYMEIASIMYKKINRWSINEGFPSSSVFYMQHPRSRLNLEDYTSNKFGWVSNNNQYTTAEEVICLNTKAVVLSICSTSQIYALNILKIPCVTVTNKSIRKHRIIQNYSNYLRSLGAKQIDLS